MSLSVMGQSRLRLYSPDVVQHFIVISSALCLAVLSQLSGLDLVIAKSIFAFEGGEFLRNHPLLETVLHKGGRYLVGVILLSFLAKFIWSLMARQQNRFNLRLWGYLFTATTASILAVSTLKQFTTLPCPWDLQVFGGTREYISVVDALGKAFPLAHCFPSGHASGGFALISCYFAARQKSLYIGNNLSLTSMAKWFIPALVLGSVFAVAQQFRGAHFLSHDFTTIGVCYLTSWMLEPVFFLRNSRQG